MEYIPAATLGEDLEEACDFDGKTVIVTGGTSGMAFVFG